MSREPNRILGINPGTRYLGLAIFDGSNLLEWRVKTFTGKWTKEKADRILDIIREQIELYDISAIAIKKLHPSRSSGNLKLLVSRMVVLGKKKRIKVESYSIKELEKLFITKGKLNKQNLAEKVVVEYPMLIREIQKDKENNISYHLRVIEAIALGLALELAPKKVR